MVITGNGAKGHHKFTLEVLESSTSGNSSFLSYTFKISPLSSGWDWYGWGSKISYTITINGTNYTGTIPSYDGSSTVTLKTGANIEVAHESDGTKTIAISFSVTDGAGQSYTCGNASASGTMTLTALHKAPTLTYTSVAESNSTISSLGITTQVVTNLSKKTFTIGYSFSDSATISSASIFDSSGKELTSTSSLSASSGTITIDLSNQSITTVDNTATFTIQIKDSLNGTASVTTPSLTVIPYTKPNLTNTNTKVKRYTNSTYSLVDGKLGIVVNGLFYKESDVIGNANSIVVEYKTWSDTEPTSYTTISYTPTSGSISISQMITETLDIDKTGNYIIAIKDNFTSDLVTVSGTIPLGKALWTEYKDRVDFEKITTPNAVTINSVEQDYIVEQGTSGIWSYRKWNSGLAECWGTKSISTTVNSAWGTMYIGATKSGQIDYPFTFTERPIEIVTARNSGWGLWTLSDSSAINTTTKTDNYNVCRPTSAGTTTLTINYDFRVTGKWK